MSTKIWTRLTPGLFGIGLFALAAGMNAPGSAVRHRLLAPPVLRTASGGKGGFVLPVSVTRALPGAGIARNRLDARTAMALTEAETDPRWLSAKAVVHKEVVELLRQHDRELEAGLTHAKLMHGDRARKQIALTFDDGPHPGYTSRLLEILKQENVKATFFLVGEMAEKHPELVREEAEAGHTIGNHTYHHVSLPKIPAEYVATEIKACGEVLQGITGKAPFLFRPPGGEYTDKVAEVSEALGYRMVLWTDDPGDYASPGAAVVRERLLRDAANGGILLLHDGIQQTLNVLPGVIERLKARGYEFVTVDEMLGLKRKAPVHSRRQETA